MHEFSIASSIVENVLELAERERASKVLEVRLVIGEFTHIEGEQVRFCFEAIVQGTALEGAVLVV